ncbi:MAG TPA: hypothetical protein VG935_00165 [Patescibacteria group bacterium]|nr:hypothetical protein [Patescibacteria group bacterium]
MPRQESLPGVIDLAKETWVIYKKRFWNIVGVAFLSILYILGYIFIGGLGGFLLSLLFAAHWNIFAILFSSLIALVYLVGFMLLFSWSQASFVVVIRDSKEAIGSRVAFQKARSYALPLLLTSLLSFVIVMGGVLVFVIPGILFGIWFGFAVYAVVCEDKKGLLALHTSREYFRGRFWQILGRQIGIHLPELVLSLILTSLVNQHLLPVSLRVLYQIASLVVMPFYMIYTYLLYTKVREVTGKITAVPTGNKRVYFGLPLIGFALLVITGITVVPFAMKAVPQVVQQVQKLQGKNGGVEDIHPSTQIAYGLVSYFLINQKFPQNLQTLVDKKLLPAIPQDTTTGLPYRYSAIDNGQDFKLCTPTGVKPEKCVTSKSKSFDL